MATSREDARPLQRCGWRADGRRRYPATYTTSWDATGEGGGSYLGLPGFYPVRAITYIFGHHEMIRPGYHWATEVLEKVAADRASEIDERPAWASEDAPFVTPPRYVAAGEIGLADAIRDFCEKVSGPSHGRLTLPEIARLAQPVRDLLVKDKVHVMCISPGSPVGKVDASAFRDDGTWMATLWDHSQLPTRPELGIAPGALVVDRDAFEEATSSSLGNVDATTSPVDPAKIVAHDDRLTEAFAFAREFQERFDLSLDYHFNRGTALNRIKELLDAEGRENPFSDSLLKTLITLIGNPKWDGIPPPPDKKGRRSADPKATFGLITYPQDRIS